MVVFAGSAIDMSAWKDEVSAIVWAGFCGEGGGEALADILAGARLAFGKALRDHCRSLWESTARLRAVTAMRSSPGMRRGLDVGYRYYDTYNIPVAFPFGHGLSYARFVYSGLAASVDGDSLTLQFAIGNESDVGGKEIAQIYVRPLGGFVYRPERELKAYEKVFVNAHESASVVRPSRSLGVFLLVLGDGRLEGG